MISCGHKFVTFRRLKNSVIYCKLQTLAILEFGRDQFIILRKRDFRKFEGRILFLNMAWYYSTIEGLMTVISYVKALKLASVEAHSGQVETFCIDSYELLDGFKSM